MEFVQKSIFMELGEDEIPRSLKFDGVGAKNSIVIEKSSKPIFVENSQSKTLEVFILQPILVYGSKKYDKQAQGWSTGNCNQASDLGSRNLTRKSSNTTQRKVFQGATPNGPYSNEPSDLNSNFSKISLKTFELNPKADDLRSEEGKLLPQKMNTFEQKNKPTKCLEYLNLTADIQDPEI